LWLSNDLSNAVANTDETHEVSYYFAMPKKAGALGAYNVATLGRVVSGPDSVTWWSQPTSAPTPPDAIVGLQAIALLNQMGFRIGPWELRKRDFQIE
jgi:hypothetical protein